VSKIGVLALQGDVVEHLAALERCGASSIPVKTPADLARVDALIVPGGESTTVMKLLDRSGLARPIVERTRAGMPLWGTCMGMIVAAHDVFERSQPTLDLIDITVRRNAFGTSRACDPGTGRHAVSGNLHPRAVDRTPWAQRCGACGARGARRDGARGKRAGDLVPPRARQRRSCPSVLPPDG
jgi:5'-phosphate synthase pdxT subunit